MGEIEDRNKEVQYVIDSVPTSSATVCATIWKARRLTKPNVDRDWSDLYLFMRETSNERGAFGLFETYVHVFDVRRWAPRRATYKSPSVEKYRLGSVNLPTSKSFLPPVFQHPSWSWEWRKWRNLQNKDDGIIKIRDRADEAFLPCLDTAV